jgi:hypothetical protein
MVSLISYNEPVNALKSLSGKAFMRIKLVTISLLFITFVYPQSVTNYNIFKLNDKTSDVIIYANNTDQINVKIDNGKIILKRVRTVQGDLVQAHNLQGLRKNNRFYVEINPEFNNLNIQFSPDIDNALILTFQVINSDQKPADLTIVSNGEALSLLVESKTARLQEKQQ